MTGSCPTNRDERLFDGLPRMDLDDLADGPSSTAKGLSVASGRKVCAATFLLLLGRIACRHGACPGSLVIGDVIGRDGGAVTTRVTLSV